MKTYIIGLEIAHYTALIGGGMIIGAMLSQNCGIVDFAIGTILAIVIAITTKCAIIKERDFMEDDYDEGDE